MKILVFCPHFAPDLHAATGEVMTRLVEHLADFGHELTVVTSLPWYRGHDVDPEWRGRPWRTERTGWGRIVRSWPFPTSKSRIRARAVGFAAQTCLSTAVALPLRRHDVVLAMSPPLFLAEAARLHSFRMRAPLVLNTQDIFPDVAIELGAISGARTMAGLRWHERSLYRSSDAITVLSPDQRSNIAAKIGPGEDDKIHMIKNFVDVDRITPVARNNWYRDQLGLTQETVVMYSGNVGLSQSFDLVRSAAIAYTHRHDVHFVINGEGAGRVDVDRWATGMDNVSVVDFGTREQVPDILGAADLHLILLKSGLAASSTPSKLYGILAAGRPVLASVDSGSEVAKVVEQAECGLAVAPDDPDAFSAALDSLLEDHLELDQQGKRARAFAEQLQSPRDQAAAYDRLFRQLTIR